MFSLKNAVYQYNKTFENVEYIRIIITAYRCFISHTDLATLVVLVPLRLHDFNSVQMYISYYTVCFRVVLPLTIGNVILRIQNIDVI